MARNLKQKFIGIDFSKLTFDATIYGGEHAKFSNDTKGFEEFLSWTEQHIGETPLSACLFCGENTGNYSTALSDYLYVHSCTMWLESPLRIKRTIGLARGKDDKIDSAHIARYAARNVEDAVAYEPNSSNIGALRKLFSRRALLVSLRTALVNSSKEAQVASKQSKYDKAMKRLNDKEIERFTKDIECIEEMMRQLIKKDLKLNKAYQQITSINGLGPINAIALITVTEAFTKYAANAKKLACHAGVAPFKKESGTSIHSGTHVSHLSNHTLKPLLTQAALAAIRYNPKISAYYQRLILKGEKSQVALNNVKNKLLHIVIALIRKDEKFSLDYQPEARNNT